MLDGRRCGCWRTFHPDGRLALEETVVQATEHGQYRVGVWRAYHANGRVHVDGTFLRGYRHGPWRFLRPDGSLAQDGAFAFDRPVGAWQIRDGAGTVLRTVDGPQAAAGIPDFAYPPAFTCPLPAGEDAGAATGGAGG
jgi:antitoxin component YwqK of YwqJK toxin-antitoxin module